MIKDRMVRIKLKKQFHEQRSFCYVGKVTAFSENWVVADVRGIMMSRTQPNGVQIDEHSSAMMFSRESIDSIRVLPDQYDMKDIQISTEGTQLRLAVKGAMDAYLGEMGEG